MQAMVAGDANCVVRRRDSILQLGVRAAMVDARGSYYGTAAARSSASHPFTVLLLVDGSLLDIISGD